MSGAPIWFISQLCCCALSLTYYPSSVSTIIVLPVFPIGDLFLRFMKLQRLWMYLASHPPLSLVLGDGYFARKAYPAGYVSNAWGADAGANVRALTKLHPDKSIQIGYGDRLRSLVFRPWLAFAGCDVGPLWPVRKQTPKSKIRWIPALTIGSRISLLNYIMSLRCILAN